MPLVSSKLITNIMFSIYRTPATLGLYINNLHRSPIYLVGSYIVEFNIPTYLGLYSSFPVVFPF